MRRSWTIRIRTARRMSFQRSGQNSSVEKKKRKTKDTMRWRPKKKTWTTGRAVSQPKNQKENCLRQKMMEMVSDTS